jgi:hypothetical protein
MSNLMPFTAFMDDQLRLSAQLINDASFPLSSEARLLVLITSIEVIWKRPPATPTLLALINSSRGFVNDTDATSQDKFDVNAHLQNLITQSIRQTCRQNITRLLGTNRADEYLLLNRRRGAFTHSGVGRSDLVAEGNQAYQLANDVLQAELRSRQSEA